MKSEWKNSSIEKICTLVTDGAHNSPKSVDFGEYMASVKDFTDYGFDFSGCRRISEADYLKLKKQGCVPEKGDILVGKDGARFFEDIIIYEQDETPALLSSIAILRPDRSIVTPEFLYYTFKVPSIKKDVRDNYGSGSAIPRIVLKDFKRMKVSFPSIKEQKRITAIFEGIDNKIKLNLEINDNLLQQAMAIFDSVFPGIAFGDKTVGNYITPKRGKNLLSKDAVFGSVPVVAGGLEPSTYHNQSNTVAPVLTISASGANAGFVNLWNIPVWSSDSSFIDSSMTKDVYFWYVLLKKRQKEIYDSQTGSAQPHIYPQHIAVLPLSDLKGEAMAAYTDQVAPLFDLIGANKRENVCLASVRNTLLPKLMSGELDISGVET